MRRIPRSTLRTLLMILLLVALLAPIFSNGSNNSVSANPSSQDDVQIKVWWPDALNPIDARQVLDDEFADFQQVVGVNLEIRRRVYVEGEYITHLSLTDSVAPSALPDLILIRRSDLTSAARQGLISPIESWLSETNGTPSNLLAGLPSNQRALGSVDGQLYGLPYLIQISGFIYPANSLATYPTTFQDVLSQNISLLFAASPLEDRSVSNVVLFQYLAAGGAMTDADGNPSLDSDIVLELLEFYAEASNAGLIPSCVGDSQGCLLNYDSPKDYWTLVPEETAQLTFIDSSLFLQRREARFQDFTMSSLFTLDGNQFVALDGWMWALVTNDPARQFEAKKFIEWMTFSDKMSRVAEALHMLPSQEGAFRLMNDSPVIATIQSLAQGATFVGEEQKRGLAALALQTAFEQVLQGIPPLDARDRALETLSQ